MAKFDVSDVTLDPNGPNNSNELKVVTSFKELKDLEAAEEMTDGQSGRNISLNQITINSTDGNLALYQEDLRRRPRISDMLSNLVQYETVVPNPKKGGKGKKKKQAKMGTIMGVYLPTLQNILGVILFLRLSWIVGIAGVGQSFLLVLLCCITTFLTTISLSAIATNGVVPAGGAYFMISRNLGPEFGGAVGILFYLATTFASALYILGAIEILLTYIVPKAALFGEVQGNPTILYNNLRIYGTILLFLMAVIVFIGVKLVNYFASFCLVTVIIAVVSIYAGAFNPIPRESVCTVDGVPLLGGFTCPDNFNTSADNFTTNSSAFMSSCNPENPVLQDEFVNEVVIDGLQNRTIYDPIMGWKDGFSPTCLIGIPAITRSRTIVDNTRANYLSQGESKPGQQAQGNQIRAAINTSFLILIGIFFPSVTGIMAGSNRSGDLKDAQKSIPIGTIAAQLTTSLIYLSCILFFGSTVSGFYLRDQFGDSNGNLIVSVLAWPTKWIILIGALFSTIGAGLQSLVGAPRLLQAIANDDLIPILKWFKKVSPWNKEPTIALIMTICLSEVGILIASLDYVAPILSMFFLMCYMFVNIACTLQSYLQSPNWRPRFKFYHWSTSLLGALMCLIIMFLSSWYYALAALVIAVIIYKYIEYRGAEKEWGDGLRGLSLQAARYSLLQLEERPIHTKNWRPQLLILVRLNDSLIPTHPKLLSFASQLKAGKGLTMITSVMKGDFIELKAETVAAKQTLKKFVEDNKIHGFVKVVACPDPMDGISYAIQGEGLGGMTHNTVMMAWPTRWRRQPSWQAFIKMIQMATLRELAVLVPKGINWFPSNVDKMRGYIDIWWVVHDGGLLMLLPFLLRQHKVWRNCKLRIFTIAQLDDNSLQMKRDLGTFLYQLRIEAVVDVIEMPDTDISPYTYERTLVMEQRTELLKKIKLTKRESKKEIQSVISKSFYRRSESMPAGPATGGGPNQYTPSAVQIKIDEAEEEATDSDMEGGHRMLDALDVPQTAVKGASSNAPPTIPKSMEGLKRFEQMFQDSSADEGGPNSLPLTPQEENLRRMNTSVKLNELIVTKSHDSALVIVNLPTPPSKTEEQENYMEFLDVLTEGLERVLMVRGGGHEVVTIYS